ncbi:unnamed protein product [Nezara viridula]|uniref:Uncharacterized protein n=1 Tax=Nezara viridula TaxID=85310 RepID=A0A9P0E949_NEZVI|nr:unnamed protein product [Nezara viridula]
MEFVEEYIKKEVLPLHSNIYSATTFATLQSSFFREEARDILSSAVNASEEDILLFVGNSCTGVLNKLIDSLNITTPPVVFIGACEHQSNVLPWIKIKSTIVRISETKEGMLDLTDLEAKLIFHQKHSNNKTMIGCFSAASATTGILADDIATTILLHQYGALAFWDYAVAAPYVSLDMNPIVPGINQKGAYKDVMFFSGQKFVGGLQSSGILVAKKILLKTVPHINNVISSYELIKENLDLKAEEVHLYEDNGASGVLESVRAGIAMKIKQTIGVSAIMEREAKIVKTVCSFFRKIPEIILLGSTTHVDRLAIFSFMVRHPRGSFLHHNFVCAILNDMFGIQARGGCTCAETYAQDLMGIEKNVATTYGTILNEESTYDVRNQKNISNYEILRPGFTRISLPFFMSESEMAYVLESIKMVATEGWKLLPQYLLHPETGEWRHNSNTISRERKRLGSIMYSNGKMLFQERKLSGMSSCPVDFNDCLRIARSTFNKARKIARRYPVADQCSYIDEKFKNLRWFMLPTEAQDLLLGNFQNVKQDVPFSPTVYKGSKPEISKLSIDCKKPQNVRETAECLFRDPRYLRQRSESNSPAREEKDSKHKQLLRERCYSLCSALVPENNNRLMSFSRPRLLSGGSQADYTDSETSLHGDEFRVATPPPCLRNTPDLVYVEGITKELATEIKSELREVIAQVEDVLSENNDSDHNGHYSDKRGSVDYHNIYKRKAFSLPNNDDGTAFSIPSNTMMAQRQLVASKSCCTHSNLPTTISAERFSEYLVGFTSDVVSEMKSEFRDVVNAVDGLISPTPTHTEDKSENENSLSEIEAIPNTNQSSNNIINSQDSGINLADRDSSSSELSEKMSVSSDATTNEKTFVLSDMKLDGASRKLSNAVLWHLPPKNVWNPTCEAIKEFDMIKEGDHVLISLTNKRESFLLLHTLHQYQYYSSSKGKNFFLGVFVEHSLKNNSVVSYLEPLGVEIYFEEKSVSEDNSTKGKRSGNYLSYSLKNKQLCELAKANNFNVLALGNHLDDLAENFLMSVFYKGHLRTMKANFKVLDEDIRVIRPFIFIREKMLNRFAENINLPKRNSITFETSQERIRIKQLLSKQEMLYPKLFHSLKSAMMPLMYDITKSEENKD